MNIYQKKTLMAFTLVVIVISSCQTQTIKMDTIWNKINNTTWFQSDDWAGKTYTFFEDTNGEKKCLEQFLGSGVYATSANFVKTLPFIENYILKNDSLIHKNNKTVLTKHSNKPLIFDTFKQIDIELFKKDSTMLDHLSIVKSLQKDFQIHIFKKEDVDNEFPTEIYEYGEEWQKLLSNLDLKKATIIIETSNIKSYNWLTQHIKLTNAGKEKLINYMSERRKNNNYIGHDKFIATINNHRIYAGEFLTYMSAMAIMHPVINYDFIENSEIRIFPIHTINPNFCEIEETLKNRTATKEIKDLFMNTKKITNYDEKNKTIIVPIISNTVYKNGEEFKAMFVRLSVKDYYIKFSESDISFTDLEKYLNTQETDIKVAEIEIEFRDNNTEEIQDVFLKRPINDYVIIHKLIIQR